MPHAGVDLATVTSTVVSTLGGLSSERSICLKCRATGNVQVHRIWW